MKLFNLFKKNKEKEYARPGRDHNNIEKLQNIGKDLNFYIM